MPRVVLLHQGHEIPLPLGDTIIGRALECRVRFNDPAVSRRHVRLLVRRDGVVAHDLGTLNGTLVNGARLAHPVGLKNGDEIRIGYRVLRVELVEDGVGRVVRTSGPVPIVIGREVAPGLYDDEDEGDPGDGGGEATRPGSLTTPIDGDPPFQTMARALAASMDPSCPSCRAVASHDSDVCPRCGHVWSIGRPTSRTQEIVVTPVAVRAHPRFAVEVPVVYSSETLGIDALVRDLSRGGMFIATDLLDPTGTPCEVTALPDGHQAVTFAGVVAHVVNQGSSTGRPAGFGIRFTRMSDEAKAWMDSILIRHERPTSPPPTADEPGGAAPRFDPTSLKR